MKLRKLLLCLLAAACVATTPAISAAAAESDTTASVATEDIQVEEKNTEDTTVTTVEADVEENTETKEEEKEVEVAETEVPKAETATTTKSTTKKTTSTKKTSYTQAELRLLACLIYCEASGEPYAGKLAVGIVVLNRKASSSFPNTIKGVIYQKYQFGPVRNGSLNRAFKRYDSGKFTTAAEKACLKAAKAALSGTKTVTYNGKELNLKGFLYFSGKVSGAKLTIAHHQFK
jgi:spore germination cell wall hydrolase CwlJ-like protein